MRSRERAHAGACPFHPYGISFRGGVGPDINPRAWMLVLGLRDSECSEEVERIAVCAAERLSAASGVTSSTLGRRAYMPWWEG